MKPTMAWIASPLLVIPLIFAGAACDQVAPPLEQLPLRDTLRADPDVVAALPDDARQQLAVRFQAARVADTGDDAIDDADRATPDVLVARADRARASRGQDAQVTGAIA